MSPSLMEKYVSALFQRAVLGTYLPAIRKFDHGIALLSEVSLPSGAAQQIRAKALQFAANSRMRVAERTEALALAELFPK